MLGDNQQDRIAQLLSLFVYEVLSRLVSFYYCTAFRIITLEFQIKAFAFLKAIVPISIPLLLFFLHNHLSFWLHIVKACSSC